MSTPGAPSSARARFKRFVIVSAATFVTGHLILYGLHSVLDIEPVLSNLLSTLLNTAIVLVANRRWVWTVGGRIDIRSEVVPFAVLAAAGLALSTTLVWLTARTIGEGLWINAANFAGFGLLWLARFAVVDQWVYGKNYAPRSNTKAPTV